VVFCMLHRMSSIAVGQGHDLRYAPVNATSLSQDNTIVSGDAGRKIKVVSYVLVAAATTSARWKSSGATALSGAMALSGNGGVSAQNQPSSPQFECADGEDLILNIGSGAGGVQGHVSYILEA